MISRIVTALALVLIVVVAIDDELHDYRDELNRLVDGR
jgi:predicted DNA-binding ArsR family transcriptional regulator